MSYGDVLVNFLSLIGLWAVFWYLYDVLSSLLHIIVSTLKGVFIPSERKSLAERYGQWAVITGSTDGIGKQYAKELARHGMNIVLISRTESKLIEVAKEIESTYAVKTKYVVIDFSAGKEIYDVIRKELKGFDIGVLVNNVGSFHEYPDYLDRITENLIWQIVNINVGAVTMMSRMIVPQMKANRRGIIVNISSGSEYQPLPLGTIYASSKVYTRNFTLALSKELEKYNVEVQLVTPMYVKTKINNYSTSLQKKSFLIPDVESYTKSAVFTLGKSSQTNGYWSHSLQTAITKLVPMHIRTYVGFKLLKKFRNEYYEQQKSSKSKL